MPTPPHPPTRRAAFATPASAIEAYIRGKDGNRPHLLRGAFTEHAQLRMHVRTTGISFPAGATGRAAISDLLVRRFNQTWENVYTLCIGNPPAIGATAFSCNWLVVMSAKSDGCARAGCGRYDWEFDPATGMARSLAITIEAMETVDGGEDIADWIATLPYPWCVAQQLEATAPDSSALRAVLERLRPTS